MNERFRRVSCLLCLLLLATTGCGQGAAGRPESNNPIEQLATNCVGLCELYEEKAELAKQLDTPDAIRRNHFEIESWCDKYESKKKAGYKLAQACREAHLAEAREVLALYSARWKKADKICSKEIMRIQGMFKPEDDIEDKKIDWTLSTRFGLDADPFR